MSTVKEREAVGTEEYFERPRFEMLPFVPADAKKILEIGCGKGAFAKLIKKRQSVRYTGIEYDAEAGRLASGILDEVLVGECEIHLRAFKPGDFDCIILNDVLEHLRDPWAVLAEARKLLSPGGTVVASIPNFRHHRTFWSIVWSGEWRYSAHGILDRTHIRFFTRKSIEAMFKDAGLKVKILRGINGRFAWQWLALNLLLLGRAGDTRFLQFAVVAENP